MKNYIKPSIKLLFVDSGDIISVSGEPVASLGYFDQEQSNDFGKFNEFM